MKLEVVRGVELLYAVDARDLVVPFVADLAERARHGALEAVAEIAARNDDARAMLLIGKGALRAASRSTRTRFRRSASRNSRRSARRSTRAMVYSIARQESAFDPQGRLARQALRA